MEKLLEMLREAGLNLPEGTDEVQVRDVARAMGIDPSDHIPRKVEIVEYTNKRGETNTFVKTDAFVVGVNEKGKKQTVQGLFVRTTIVDQVIEDLVKARGMLIQG